MSYRDPNPLDSLHLLPPKPFYFHLLLKISMDRNNYESVD